MESALSHRELRAPMLTDRTPSAIADDDERSLIALQVEMGVATRMACLELLFERT
jgi:aspartate carbamoyltransferase catalytic subunit